MPLPTFKADERRRIRANLGRWFKANGRDLPWRRTRDPYAILVSEMMLQQTQVATVIPYFERWMENFPDVATLAAAAEDDVLHAWQGLGYYARARNLHRAARAIVRNHEAIFPQDLEAIRALPGVGRYTAGAVATFAFDAATPVVDANIARVLARLTDIHEPIDSTLGRERLWKTAAELLPPNGGRLHNSALMELGALVCLPRAPRCGECPVRSFCFAKDPGQLPRKRARRATVSIVENCVWVRQRDNVLLELQLGKRWRGLWKLPQLPSVAAEPNAAPLLRSEYPFTHHRVKLSVFKSPALKRRGLQWHPLTDLPAMPSPHRRAVEALGTIIT